MPLFAAMHEFDRAARAPVRDDQAEVPVPGRRTLVQMLEATLAEQPAGEEPARTSHDVHALAAHGLTGPAQPLPHGDRLQALFGRHDLRGVQAHVGGPAAEAAGAMGAAAYATGSSVAFAQSPDLHTAAHEAAHVIQQRAGVHLSGGVGQAGDAHERHADAVADRVVQGRSAEDLLDAYRGAGAGAAVQHRTIAAAVYSAYDADKARASTKAMLEAAQIEDEVKAMKNQLDDIRAAMNKLKQDAFVGTEAKAAAGTFNANARTVESAKTAITAAVDVIEPAFTSAVASLKPVTASKGGSIADRLRAKAEAQKAQDAQVLAAIAAPVATSRDEGDKARAAFAAMQDKVRSLTDKAAQLREAKHSYHANLSALDSARQNDVERHAADLGVAVPDLDASYDPAKDHATRSEWIEADQASRKGRAQLDQVKQGIAEAERAQNQFATAKLVFRKLPKIRDSFTELRILDAQLVAAEKLAGEAQAHYDARRWAEAASTGKDAARAVPDLEELVAKFDAYRTGARPKLLAGTIKEVHDQLVARGPYTNEQALGSLEATYHAQCTISRQNWLQHLNIAGNDYKGSFENHWTQYNDSIPAVVNLRVDLEDVDALCTNLFAAVATNRQLHATRVVGGTHYHRYWDGTESPDVAADNLPGTHPVEYAQLIARFNAMQQAMREGVTAAKENHGRVSHNNHGQQTPIVLV